MATDASMVSIELEKYIAMLGNAGKYISMAKGESENIIAIKITKGQKSISGVDL